MNQQLKAILIILGLIIIYSTWVIVKERFFRLPDIKKASPYTCEMVYRGESNGIIRAIKEYSKTGKLIPTLDELVAEGLYTLPQNKELIREDYPINPHDLRVKLIFSDRPDSKYIYKIVVTSTKGKCKSGKTYIYHRGSEKDKYGTPTFWVEWIEK